MNMKRKATEAPHPQPLPDFPTVCATEGCGLLTYWACAECGQDMCVFHERLHLHQTPEDAQPKRKRRPKPKKVTFPQRYLWEIVLYGGVWMRRGDVIADLESQGLPPRARDMFLFGQDSAMERLRAQWKADNEHGGQDGKDGRESEASA